ncbi:MAG: dienelactone hydrolase family protein [Burkholderiales bacterium]
MFPLAFRSNIRRIGWFALKFWVIAFISSAQAQITRIEVHPLATQTVTSAEFLTGKKDGKRETIAGELRIPRPGNARLPAVILMHGASGLGDQLDDWAHHLNSMGVATFVLDSFTGRGLTNSESPGAVSMISRVVDAYRALELLARHPRIDPDRIAIMGFSHGGWAALYSSLKRFMRMHGPAEGRMFAAHIVFYPGCIQTYLEGDDIVDKPIRIFHGSVDDQLPIEPCREYVARLRKAGKDVSLTEYAGAYHAFDVRALKEPLKQPQAISVIRCRLAEAADGQMVTSDTRQPFGLGDPCVGRGRTLAYHAEAHSAAVKAVSDFVSATLRPN